MTPEYCGYYGLYKGKLYGNNLVTYLIDENVKRILVSHQEKFLSHVKDMLIEEFKLFNDKFKRIQDKIERIENKIKNKDEK